MKTLLIVYHSMTGGTRQMAKSAAAGVAAKPPACGPADVVAADDYLFATPENLAAVSGLMKDFFDRCHHAALDRINGRPFATMVCGGSDGRNAACQVKRIATGWWLKPVAELLIVRTHAQAPEQTLCPKQIGPDDLARCAELGAGLAARLSLGVF